jgi:hypothetical protein
MRNYNSVVKFSKKKKELVIGTNWWVKQIDLGFDIFKFFINRIKKIMYKKNAN